MHQRTAPFRDVKLKKFWGYAPSPNPSPTPSPHPTPLGAYTAPRLSRLWRDRLCSPNLKTLPGPLLSNVRDSTLFMPAPFQRRTSWVLIPWQCVGADRSVFWSTPAKKVAFFRSKLLLDNCKFYIIQDETFVSKWKVKLIFPGIYRLSRTVAVECLENWRRV